MSYADCYLIPIKAEFKQRYIETSDKMTNLFKEYGAISVTEFWSNELAHGEITSFPRALLLEEGECVVMGQLQWPSKEVRDAAWMKLFNDERMHANEPFFDGKRMIMGGFDKIVG